MGIYSGKVVAVTGGGSGIGRAGCERLARDGASVAVLDINLAAAQSTADLVNRAGGCAIAGFIDVANRESVFATFGAVGTQFERLDLAVNSAGVGGVPHCLENVPEADWEHTIAVNLSGVFYSMQAQFPLLKDGGGTIINISSVMGMVGCADAGPYVAAKHGIVGLTKSAAISWGKQNIRVVAVCPTFVRTGLNQERTEAEWTQLAALHPLGRLPSLENVAGMIAYLGSDDAAAVSGSVHLIDCGYTAG